MAEPDIDVLHRSLKRCYQNPRFLDLFYENFLSTSAEVRQHFAQTDMARQKRMVEASLFTSILAADGVPYALKTITHLGRKHCHLGVAPPLYDLWLESLIAAVAACDDAFDDAVERAWRASLRTSIDRMLAQYPCDA